MIRQGWLAGCAVVCGVALASPADRLGGEREAPAVRAPQQKLAMVLDLRKSDLARWHELQAERRPSRIAELAAAFLRDYPQSPHGEDAKVLEAGALRAAALAREVGLSGEFFVITNGDDAFDAALHAAARGDAEAAYRVARAYIEGKSGVFASLYRHEQWLRIAGELGHARASWDLAQLYNTLGRVAEAAHFEKRAISLGYKPPPRLSTRDY